MISRVGNLTTNQQATLVANISKIGLGQYAPATENVKEAHMVPVKGKLLRYGGRTFVQVKNGQAIGAHIGIIDPETLRCWTCKNLCCLIDIFEGWPEVFCAEDLENPNFLLGSEECAIFNPCKKKHRKRRAKGFVESEEYYKRTSLLPSLIIKIIQRKNEV